MTDHTHDIIVVDDQKSILDDFARLLAASESGPLDSLDALAASLGAAPAKPPPRHKLPSYQVHYALQGLEAVALHERLCGQGRPVAVAFVDIQMPPGIDGIETVSRLWRVQPDLEVVLCTAYSDYSWHSILDRLDRRDQLVILRKPFDPIEVRQLAACLSEKWSRGRALAQRMDELEIEVRREVQRRLQLELRDIQKFEELGKLAAGVAHEINSPMQYIQMSVDFVGQSLADVADILATDQPDLDAARAMIAELPAAVEDARTGVRRVTKIVRSVRDYAHTRRAATLEVVDVNAQIQVVAELVRAQFRHELDIQLELADTPGIVGDTDELSRALLNIMLNAAQAIQSTRQGGRRGQITVRATGKGDGVEIEIEDTGRGIPREHWDHVFEPFYTTKPRGEGTGQGLTMARSAIVERHGGSLRFTSTPGVGTTFMIELPARPPADAGAIASPTVGSAA
jgi:two-component system NtrC family sensor kinase